MGLFKMVRRFAVALVGFFILTSFTHTLGTPGTPGLSMPKLPGWSGSASAATGRHTGDQAAVVERVIDGDTVVVRMLSDGELAKDSSVTVRLLEIDTPETKKPGTPVECGGPAASAFTKRLLAAGTAVVLVPDVEHVDRYGRALRYVYTPDGKMVDQQIAAAGYARALLIEPNDAHIAEIGAAARRAQAAGRGMWGQCADPYAPAS